MNNSHISLIRQDLWDFDMDYQARLSFDNINSQDLELYGVDHVAVAEGLGCKAIRVTGPYEFLGAFDEAKPMMAKHRVPVVAEFYMERVTNIAMGMEVDAVNEFEEVLDLNPAKTLVDARSNIPELQECLNLTPT